MDFSLSEEQRAVAEAARTVFEGMSSPERVAEVEQSEDRFDADLWGKLAGANLLGLAVPEQYGGSGLGMSELCLLLEQQGRAVAPVPLWATLVLGALAIAELGSPEQRARWLPEVVSGDVRLSAALSEAALGAQSVVARPGDKGRWMLSGRCFAVPHAHLAGAVLVPTDRGLFLVDPHGPGVSLERAVTTDRQVHPHLYLDGVVVDEDNALGHQASPDGSDAVVWLLERARTGLAALALGVCERALEMTADHLNQRHQFGRPLSSFQGAMLRAADAWIDTEAIRVTVAQAAWRLDFGRPAAQAVAAAKWWASEAGQRVVHATQHLHGGLGADVSYPIHRYFLWGKQIELMLGSPSAQLAELGGRLAEQIKAGRRLSPGEEVPDMARLDDVHARGTSSEGGS